MNAYREKDYDDMAGRCVDRFLSGETKLADAAVHEAMQGQLNPDQIERLVQAANTMAFLRMMESRKAEGAPDMTHEFDPVDTSHVLQQIIGQSPMGGGEHGGMPEAQPPGMPGMQHPGMQHGGPPEMANMPPELAAMHGGAPDHDAGPLPDEVGEGAEHDLERDGDGDGKTDDDEDDDDDDDDGPFPKGKKQKATDDAKKKGKPEAFKKKAPPGPPAKDEMKEAAVRHRRMSKLAAILEDQYLQAELVFEDEFNRLETTLKQAWGGPTWDTFEKNALALHGDEYGATVLNLVRQSRRLEPLPFEDVRTKHAAFVDHHIVDDNDPATQLFSRMVKIASEADRMKRAAEHARAQCG
jgi:hypothetical protein